MVNSLLVIDMKFEDYMQTIAITGLLTKDQMVSMFVKGRGFVPSSVVQVSPLPKTEWTVDKNGKDDFDRRNDQIVFWCDANVKHKYCALFTNVWVFENDDDAMLFKLTWG